MIEKEPQEAHKIFKEYWMKCQDKDFDPYACANEYEAIFTHPDFHKQFDSWTFHQCLFCNHINKDPVKYNPDWNELKKKWYKELYRNPPKEDHREMFPHQGDFLTWVYLCKPCYFDAKKNGAI